MTDAERIKELEERVAFLEEAVRDVAGSTGDFWLSEELGWKILLRPDTDAPESIEVSFQGDSRGDFMVTTGKPGNT